MTNHCFISYSTVDAQDFAFRLYDELTAGPPSVPVWLDKRDINPGRNWDDQIVEAIKLCGCLIFVMSPDSVESGSVCKNEWMLAITYKKPIIPILLDGASLRPFLLGTRQHIDFTNDFKTGLAALRKHLEWLKSPAGELQNLKDRLTDARHDLRRAVDATKQKWIKEEIQQLKTQIALQEQITSQPGIVSQQYEDETQSLVPYVIEDIIKGKCVLFLGPELLINKDGKYYKSFFKELESKNQHAYKYFSRDNLFSIIGENKNLNKRKLISKISEFYKNAGDEIILNLISQIPFSLIINVAPDLGINKFFEKNNFNFRAVHFPDDSSHETPPPTINYPVIYNIFGQVNDINSLIVTHDDLFKAIKSLMQEGSIPINIHNFLKNANSFIFIGLKFETWYYQLLPTILGIEKLPSSTGFRIGIPDEIDNDSVSIMNSYFHISFAKNNPLKVVQTIYDALKEGHSYLRKPLAERPQTVAYISYAWKDDLNTNREKFVDLIYDELTRNASVKIFRDRNVLTIQDSIDSFMNRIGRGKAVIMVVSDKYLRSEYCMYEAWQVYNNNNFTDRVFIAVLSDVDKSPEGINNYVRYWKEKKDAIGSSLFKEFKDDIAALNNLVVRNKNLFYIYLFIEDFLKIILDTIHYQVPDSFDDLVSKNEFQNFTQLISAKLHEGNE